MESQEFQSGKCGLFWQPSLCPIRHRNPTRCTNRWSPQRDLHCSQRVFLNFGLLLLPSLTPCNYRDTGFSLLSLASCQPSSQLGCKQPLVRSRKIRRCGTTFASPFGTAVLRPRGCASKRRADLEPPRLAQFFSLFLGLSRSFLQRSVPLPNSPRPRRLQVPVPVELFPI